MFVLVLNMAYNQPTKQPTEQHHEYRASPDFGLTGWNWKSGDRQFTEAPSTAPGCLGTPDCPTVHRNGPPMEGQAPRQTLNSSNGWSV